MVGITLALASGVGAGCGGEQSYAAGVKIICDAPDKAGVERVAPADRQRVISEWASKRLKNKRARSLFAELGSSTARGRKKLLQDAARETGLDTCALAQGVAPIRPEVLRRLAEVPPAHFVDIPGDAPTVVVGKHAIDVDVRQVLSLRNGDVDPALRDPRGGWRVERLIKALAAVRADAGGDKAAGAGPLVLYFDRDTPYRVVLRVVVSAMRPRAGFKDIRFVVRSGGVPRALRMSVPDRARRAAKAVWVRPAMASGELPLGLVLGIYGERIALWSISGEEGTNAKPSVTLPLTRDEGVGPRTIDEDALTKALATIVARRWRGAKRSMSSKEIIVMGEKTLPFRLLARVIAAAHGRPDAPPLFPRVLLSPGFE